MKRHREDDNRWFPGQASNQRFERGWLMSDGSRWCAEDVDSGVDLAAWSLTDGALAVNLTLVGEGESRWVFQGIADVKIDGDFQPDSLDGTPGWEVMATDMLAAAHPRADGKLVYLLELPNALLCWASDPVKSTRG